MLPLAGSTAASVLTQGFLYLVVKYLGNSGVREQAQDPVPESALPSQGCCSILVALGGMLSVMACGQGHDPVMQSRTWKCTGMVLRATSPLIPSPDEN